MLYANIGGNLFQMRSAKKLQLFFKAKIRNIHKKVYLLTRNSYLPLKSVDQLKKSLNCDRLHQWKSSQYCA